MKIGSVLCVGALLLAGCGKSEEKELEEAFAELEKAAAEASPAPEATVEEVVPAAVEVPAVEAAELEAVVQQAEVAAQTLVESVAPVAEVAVDPLVAEFEALFREGNAIAAVKRPGDVASEEQIQMMVEQFKAMPAEEKAAALQSIKDGVAKLKAE